MKNFNQSGKVAITYVLLMGALILGMAFFSIAAVPVPPYQQGVAIYLPFYNTQLTPNATPTWVQTPLASSSTISNPLATPSGGYSSANNQATQIAIETANYPAPLFYTATPTPTPTSTAIIGIIPVRTFTSSQSTTPTPIATAIASTFTHVKLFVNNTGTAGDFITVYQGANAGVPIYVAPGGGVVTKDLWATAVNGPVSIGGGNTSGSVMQVWGYFDQQTYQFPVNLPTQ